MQRSKYRDQLKYAATKKRFQEGYRKRTGAGKYGRRNWTISEDLLVLSQRMTDRQLGEKIKRSVGAIQKRRWELNRNDGKGS